MSNETSVEAASALAVETLGLTRHFGAVTAVDQLDLTIAPRSIFGLLGPNGAGKTTTIKILTTMLAPSSGTARVAGLDVLKNPVQTRKVIGYVSQMLSADGALTGYENLLLFARIYGIPRRERKARIADALEFMGLSESGNVLVRNYSGGMIRRLEIAQSMLHRPLVLFLDEPTVGLDPVARHAVWQHLRELRERFGTTILMTTHDMEEADRLCENIAIMHHGRVAAIGSPESLKKQVGPEADLNDVFVHFAGGSLDDGQGYRESVRIRRTARRLG
ncbi:MAG: multidrug ABC transporter ATP-binding protein [Candidatus Angelobacter sp. Gp1-AA117]|nr:MAG: multidrug ABC transporter ATP-binding protein [Candidatus Angelobacter sp. Gp1-AA117]